jgi:peptide/nickel transport system substrate-binding protein
MRQARLFLTALAASTLGLAALPLQAQTLNVRLNADIRGTDGLNRDANTDMVLHHIFETLVAFRGDLSVGPMLAESWTVSDDGTRYAFTIREDARFHNGAPVTAQDVIWNWERRTSAESEWFCKAFFDGRQGLEVQSVAAEDDRTVVFQLNGPSALFLAQLANVQCNGWIAHPDSIDPQGAWVTDAPIGSGPFRLASWERGQSIVLERFADYVPVAEPRSGLAGDRSAGVDQVRLLIVPDEATAEAALFAGQIDILPDMAADRLADAEARGMQVFSSPGLSFTPILIQTRDPLMSDPRLRRALAHAIDYEALAEVQSNGLTRHNPSVVPDASVYFDEAMRRWHDYDLEAARALLAEAGYDGQPIRLQTNTRYNGMYENAVLIQAMWQAAGINAELETLDWATQLDAYLAGNFQVQSFGYSARLDPSQLLGVLVGNKDTRATVQWENAEAFDLYLQTVRTTDLEARRALFLQIHELLIEDVPFINLYYVPETGVARPEVTGHGVWPGGTLRLWGISKS